MRNDREKERKINKEKERERERERIDFYAVWVLAAKLLQFLFYLLTETFCKKTYLQFEGDKDIYDVPISLVILKEPLSVSVG